MSVLIKGMKLPITAVHWWKWRIKRMTDWEYSGYNKTLVKDGNNTHWAEVHLWKCPDCGYVVNGELMRPDFDCPRCRKEESHA